MGRAFNSFIRQVTSSTTYHPDGTKTVIRDPAVWTLAHKGYSGRGRLDVWVYPTKKAALLAGAELAMECGLDDDPTARDLFAAGKYQQVLEHYESSEPSRHLLRVQAAFLIDDDA